MKKVIKYLMKYLVNKGLITKPTKYIINNQNIRKGTSKYITVPLSNLTVSQYQ